MAANDGTTMTVQAMGRMLGLKKTESYYLLHKHCFETVTINRQLRVVRNSFEEWYALQDRYRKVDGPEPGTALREQFYSIFDIADMLGIHVSSAREMIQRQGLPTMMVARKLRVPKAVFDHWYVSQNWYRMTEDRERDRPAEEISITVPEMGRMLGLDRRQAWHLYYHEKENLVLIRVSGKPRITRESFDAWYAEQDWFQLVPVQPKEPEARTYCENEIDDLQPEERTFISIHETAECLGMSEKRIYRLIECGTLDGKKIGKIWMVRRSDVENYEEEKV